MKVTSPAVAVALLLGLALATAQTSTAATGSARYARAVDRVCAGALLFEHAHAIGTDAGALAAARDIRESARRRLDRVAAIPVPPRLESLAARWISLQRRLAESYAVNWLRIHYAIDAARTPVQRKMLPGRLERYLQAPDRLRHAAAMLELALEVPDCTGGGGSNVSPTARDDELRAEAEEQP
jgi:hypothetical protein